MNLDDLAKLPPNMARKIEPVPPSECWIWMGAHTGARVYPSVRGGYGAVWVRGRMLMVHRFVYETLRGPIPPGLTLDHLCRVRSCCNPDHLEPVTHRENILRGTSFQAKNSRKTCCPRCGSAFTFAKARVRDGRLQSGGRYCKPCRTADGKRWKANLSLERKRAYARDYYARHADHIKAVQKARYARTKAKGVETSGAERG